MTTDYMKRRGAILTRACAWLQAAQTLRSGPVINASLKETAERCLAPGNHPVNSLNFLQHLNVTNHMCTGMRSARQHGN
jgi:hypothetical protein